MKSGGNQYDMWRSSCKIGAGAASLCYRNGAVFVSTEALSRKIFVSAQEAIQFNVNIALI